jgi:DNA polymerase-3 subunit epsilon
MKNIDSSILDQDLISHLESNGDYRIIKKLKPQSQYNDDDGNPKGVAIFLDTETTGIDIAKDEIIELGMVAFEYSISTGKIFKILETFNELEEPKVVISKEASEVNGITMEMVKGHKIDNEAVEAFINQAGIILAHNAKFDRQFVEKRFSFFKERRWGCSISDVSWHENGLKSRSLEFLAYKYGYFFEAHRADKDCMASIHLLSQTLPESKCLVLDNLLKNARQISDRISAKGAPFAIKDDLRARGYKWNAEKKYWFIDVIQENSSSEISWLRDEHQISGQVECTIDAKSRYSNRV